MLNYSYIEDPPPPPKKAPTLRVVVVVVVAAAGVVVGVLPVLGGVVGRGAWQGRR